VHDIVHRHGGKHLSRSGNITTLMSDSQMIAIDDSDAAGTIAYLTAGGQ